MAINRRLGNRFDRRRHLWRTGAGASMAKEYFIGEEILAEEWVADRRRHLLDKPCGGVV
jgi:hypothetical protein